MISTRWLKSAVLFCVFFCASLLYAAEFPPAPKPFRYVNDYTQTLSAAERNQLEQMLIHYSQETSSQIAVVMIPTVGENEIADYTFALGDKWGIGRKQLNNGVLMLIAKNDRKIFIATGQGLEGALPDALLAQIIRHQITPQFAQNRYAQGIADGLTAIIAASKGEYAAAVEEADWRDYLPPIIMISVFILLVIMGEVRRRNQPYISPTTNHQVDQVLRQTIRRRGNSSGIGGGFGGGSGGGFGGGGFGGGGAGGSW